MSPLGCPPTAKQLEKKTGFSLTGAMAAPAAAPAAAAAAPAAAAAADAASAETKKEEKPAEKAQADVKLISFPDGAKFNVLREVRKLKPGMNLMDVLLSLLSLLSV